jgi:Ser/Thr protein kinase RdoA (MazF antagonist)
MTMGPIPESLLSAVAAHYGFRPKPAERLGGGEESVIYRVACVEGDLVLRISPEWRSVAELTWSYRRALDAARQIPEVVAPLPTRDGMPVVLVQTQPVSLFPFVRGVHLDREKSRLRDQAAALLARLHKFFLGSGGQGTRPPAAPAAPVMRQAKSFLPELADPDLDRYLANGRAVWDDLRAPIHGDFYRGNLLCHGERIQGLIDWDDCRIGGLHQDLAWSLWEFAKDPISGDQLDETRALQFLEAYRRSAGPVPTDALDFVVPLIRKHLRYEIHRAVAAKELGEQVDNDYLGSELRAFRNLKGIELST